MYLYKWHSQQNAFRSDESLAILAVLTADRPFIYNVFSSIDSVSSWPGALFQNRVYWDSSDLFWDTRKHRVFFDRQLILCQLARWRWHMSQFTTKWYWIRQRDNNKKGKDMYFCQITHIRPKWRYKICQPYNSYITLLHISEETVLAGLRF
jgi:hypothetical protein